jgi:uncharacterized protein YjhX (UPF0386 family)
MNFYPAIHTKEFLLANPKIAETLSEKSLDFALSSHANDYEVLGLDYKGGWVVAFNLARFQPAWVKSEAVNNINILRMTDYNGFTVAHQLANFQPQWLDLEISRNPTVLRLVNKGGWSVAHQLARHQADWLKSGEATNKDVLLLNDNNGNSVAHELAQCQPEWINSDTSKSLDILYYANKYGDTVAHSLAQFQKEWIKSEAAKNIDLLRCANNDGWTVAEVLLEFNENSINHEPIMKKQILTLQREDKMLAEIIAEKYKPDGMDVPVMAMKLISQGAAYKHSKALDINVGESLLKECKLLINDSNEPLIAFKQLQAAHSTLSHNVARILRTQEQESLEEWQGLLLESESLIRQHLNSKPDLYDIEHTVDIFCEPGDGLLKKLQAERILASDLTSLSGLNHTNSSEQEPKTQSLY